MTEFGIEPPPVDSYSGPGPGTGGVLPNEGYGIEPPPYGGPYRDPFIANVDSAFAWLVSMSHPTLAAVEPYGTVTMAEAYTYEHMGPMSGGFAWTAPAPPSSGGAYLNTVVEQWVVTDIPYLLQSQPAETDGTWSFAWSNQGVKVIVVRDALTGVILMSNAPDTGLLRSYLPEPEDYDGFGELSFVYDQGIALASACNVKDELNAERFARGLVAMQVGTGAQLGSYAFVCAQMAPDKARQIHRTGASAIAVYCLLYFVQAYPANAYADEALASARLWLDTYLPTVKSTVEPTKDLYTGGHGTDADINYDIVWVSVEHNFDIWFALDLAHRVTGVLDYRTRADFQKAKILEKLWNNPAQRFHQGIQPYGPDTADPLDAHAWGAMFCVAVDEIERAEWIMSPGPIEPFEVYENGVNGWCPHYDLGGYPGAQSSLWSEGSFSMSCAYKYLDQYDHVDELVKLQQPDGSFHYTQIRDPIYELSAARSVAGTAWFILAAREPTSFWRTSVLDRFPEVVGG